MNNISLATDIFINIAYPFDVVSLLICFQTLTLKLRINRVKKVAQRKVNAILKPCEKISYKRKLGVISYGITMFIRNDFNFHLFAYLIIVS